MKASIFLLVALFLFPLNTVAQNRSSMNVSPILSLDELTPAANVFKNAVFNSETMAIDGDYLFLLDSESHRVLKYGMNGRFICQIGEIGHEDSSLYYPISIKIIRDHLLIYDHLGNKIKFFDLSGSFSQSIEIDPTLKTRGFSFDNNNGTFMTNAFREGDAPFNHDLIKSFNPAGNWVGGFGRVLPADRFVGLANLNKVYLAFVDGFLFGCFKNRPIVFKYDQKGRESFFNDLSESSNEEIEEIEREDARTFRDFEQKDPRAVALVNYFYSFSVSHGMLFCALNNSKATRGYIFELGPAGELIKTVEIFANNKSVMLLKLAKAANGGIYIIYRQNNKCFLAKYREEVR